MKIFGYEIYKKAVSRNDIIIKWANVIVLSSGNDNVLNMLLTQMAWTSNDINLKETAYIKEIDEFRKMVYASVPKNNDPLDTTIRLDPIINEFNKYHDEIKFYLIDEGYANDIYNMNAHSFVLSDKGKLMKELGGHEEYKKYRKSELNAHRNQINTNWGLLIVGALAVLVPIFIATCFHPKLTLSTPIPPNQQYYYQQHYYYLDSMDNNKLRYVSGDSVYIKLPLKGKGK